MRIAAAAAAPVADLAFSKSLWGRTLAGLCSWQTDQAAAGGKHTGVRMQEQRAAAKATTFRRCATSPHVMSCLQRIN